MANNNGIVAATGDNPGTGISQPLLNGRFALKSGARFQQLRGALASCRQMGSSVEDYFGRLTKIWDSMNECLTSKKCGCGKCECDLVSAHEKERDTIRVHDFLFGLDDVIHGAVRSQICAQIPLPDLDTVYQTILRNETIFRDFPKDLVEDEILCHVPATYLKVKRLGSTCKRWKRLFNGDVRFARKHADKAAKQFLVLLNQTNRIFRTIVDLDGRVPSVEVKSELSLVDPDSTYIAQFDICRVFHCDGLLLCTSKDESRFVVWNPFTGETRWFRPSSRGQKGREFVLGYYQEDSKKSYKVLSFCRGNNVYEIYEFSSDSWRMLDDIIAPGWSIEYSGLSVSLKGSTYWFATVGTKAQLNTSLLKFDFSTEKSVPVPLPYQRNCFALSSLSVVREEKLSVLLQRDDTCKTEIWVTNKIDETTQVVSWSNVLALDLSPHLQIFYDASFLLDEDKKVVMICETWLDMEDETETKKKDLMYIVGEDNEVTQVVFGEDVNGSWPAILSYVPSLVQIEPAAGKRKRADL